jgi:hypothetical protein
MVTAVTLALALAFEPGESGLMRRPPRQPGAPILGNYFLWRIAFVSLLIGGATIGVFLYEQQQGLTLDMARTQAVNTLVVGQIFYLFNSRFPARVEPAVRVPVRQPGGLADGRRAGGAATDFRLRALHAHLVPHGLAGEPPLAGAAGDRRGDLPGGRG